jgi:hypothetical protein
MAFAELSPAGSVLSAVTLGERNAALGKNALNSPSLSGSSNTAIGVFALEALTTGNQNCALGTAALRANTSGQFNTAIGFQTLWKNKEGIQCTAVGVNALKHNTAGKYNTGLGTEALEKNQDGEKNTAIGVDAMRKQNGNRKKEEEEKGIENGPSFSFNTAVGHNAMWGEEKGWKEGTTEAEETNEPISTAEHNVAVGVEALKRNVSGKRNVAVGNFSLHNNSASENVGIGFSALASSTNGKNVAIGFEALFELEVGSKNVAIGSEAGKTLISPSEKNVLIGFGAGPSAKSRRSNCLYINNEPSEEPLILGTFGKFAEKSETEPELRFFAKKMGFFGHEAAERPTVAAETPAAIIAALRSIGLVA